MITETNVMTILVITNMVGTAIGSSIFTTKYLKSGKEDKKMLIFLAVLFVLLVTEFVIAARPHY